MGDAARFVGGRLDLGGLVGPLWFAAWLFTVGYLHLHAIKIVWALVIWPYYLGAAMR